MSPAAEVHASRRLLHRGISAFLLVASLLLAMAAWTVAIRVWNPVNAGARLGGVAFPAPTTNLRFGELFSAQELQRTNQVQLFMHITHVSLTTQSITAQLQWVMGGDNVPNLINTKTGQPWSPMDPANSALKESFTLRVFDGVSEQSLPADVNSVYPGTDASNQESLISPILTISIPLITGSVSAYPDDSYQAAPEFDSLELPPSLAIRIGPSDTLTSIVVSHAPSVTIDPNTGDYLVTYAGPLVPADYVVIGITRNTSYRVFIYTISLLPLLLSLLLAHLLIRRATSIDILLSLVFGALFTVLPLRLVLVPLDVGVLTHVDLLLASELMLLLIVGVAGYCVEIWRSDSRTKGEAPRTIPNGAQAIHDRPPARPDPKAPR